MLYDAGGNDETQSSEEETSRDVQDMEVQKDLELAEREQQLPQEIQEKRNRGALRTGFTTGTAATAATKAALIALLSGKAVNDVSVTLPKGKTINIRIAWTNATKGQYSATAAVVKDAGDDPDVTDKAEVCSTVFLTSEVGIVSIDGGNGVGRVTKPGLGIDIGKPAINPSPKKMIEKAVSEVAAETLKHHGVKVVISVPKGEEIAKKTDNPRLGIIGGISILGTTGIVFPYSTASFAAAIRQALDVARAMGDEQVVLTTGGRSEDFAKELFARALPEHCFIQMGDFAGYSIRHCALKQIRKATIAGFVGKLTKMSMGIKQTHVRGSHVDMEFMAHVASECFPEIPMSILQEIRNANTARHVFEIIMNYQITGFFDLICKKVYEQMHDYSKGELELEVIMFDFDGKVSGQFPGGLSHCA
ncbi:MAG TPA: cobalt-precorrin-5B (C(1))-methyltransferase [Candidatus Nitrosopolaris sp.]|nr:cobalt-precorrin-5B (C(1))-methyltransferase [Candidatus Nitrosopolaris sp.]